MLRPAALLVVWDCTVLRSGCAMLICKTRTYWSRWPLTSSTKDIVLMYCLFLTTDIKRIIWRSVRRVEEEGYKKKTQIPSSILKNAGTTHPRRPHISNNNSVSKTVSLDLVLRALTCCVTTRRL